MARYASGAASKREEHYDEELYYYPETRVRRPKTKAREQTKPKAKLDILVGNIDMTMFFVVIILVIIGIIMVLSASQARMSIVNDDAFYLLRRNIPFALLGFVAMNVASRVHYLYLRKFVWVLYALTVVLLAMVVIGGVAVGGATRWVEIPVIGQFQPSELAKAAVIFAMAHLVDKYPNALKTWNNLAVFSAIVALLVGLVWLPGGFSQGLIVASVGFGMIFIASPHIWRFIAMGAGAIVAVAAYLGITAWLGTGFRGARLMAWLDPFEYASTTGFQIIQSLYAIASGGLFGEGIGQSRQASSIPEAHNDMIFAVVIEELGLIGAGLILLLFAIFIWRGIIVSMRAPDTFSSMIAIGIVFLIGFQAVINVGVVTNTIPNTGVTLPFISYGGTSLVVFMGLAGILLNISKYSKAEAG
ncbi:MAG: FtsW/RodA/SpoVE family cell cycle protein [Defluviitaleaceae bacterium]|nr:FtsW/RodA/SpoVE family cell cycle protein [Defluviitaleaceae bacterium]